MTKGIFITGTDTGVGKTYVATGIVSALKRRGVDVGVMKPAETGCTMHAGRLIPRDALLLMKAAGVRDLLALVNPYRFRKPLAPCMAADLEKQTVDPDKIIRAYHTLSIRYEYMIVEGAGGIMVPLTQKYLYLDLIRDLCLPVLIVARPSLGTINHTLLTISALRERGIMIAGVVINHAVNGKTGLAEETNPVLIERISGIKIVGTIFHGSRQFDGMIDCVEYNVSK